MKKFFILSALLCCAMTLSAQDESFVRNAKKVKELSHEVSPLINNVPGRSTFSLDGQWKMIIDKFGNGYYDYRYQAKPPHMTYFADTHFYDDQTQLVEYDFNAAKTINVPGDWNTQYEKLYFFEGSLWYRKTFDWTPESGKRYFLHFGAANYDAVVGINGNVIGRHIGGFTPFDIEVTDYIKDGENVVIVKVDNTVGKNDVPTANADWWNYGGLTRSVCLIETPATFIRDYFLTLSPDRKSVTGWVQMDGDQLQQDVTLSVPELKLNLTLKTDDKGYAAFSVKAKPQFWTPDTPKLYDVTFASGADSVTDRIGFRTIETRGSEILLNGEPVFCKGIAVHEERPGGGRAFSEEHARTILGWAKELGCNFVRLAHYPHNENTIRVAEELGIMVWSEIPVYWTINWSNPDTYANAERQLCEMIARDRNRANIIIWSVANETPFSDERLAFLSRLVDKTRELDDTRLVSAAMEKTEIEPGVLTVEDKLMDKVDLMSFNQYVGWYDGDYNKCERVNWTFPVKKPVIVSEFGGGALYGRHGDVNERFTEEYLEMVYHKNMEMLTKIPELAGVSPWLLMDFRSPRRLLDGVQDDYNRKGLVSENGGRKKAFYVLQEWYNKL